jgi:hypothetical protein
MKSKKIKLALDGRSVSPSWEEKAWIPVARGKTQFSLKRLALKAWIPVARGKTYCSPACGCGCTRLSYEQAVRDAVQLVQRLRGTGWQAQVWEQNGWHFRASSGLVQVYGDRRGKGGRRRYSCVISGSLEGCETGVSVPWALKVPDHSYPDPNRAVAAALDVAVAETMRVVRALVSASRAGGRSVARIAGREMSSLLVEENSRGPRVDRRSR